MLGLYVNHVDLCDEERRTRLFEGSIFVNSRSDATAALCEHATRFIKDAFGPRDPERAQDELALEEFIAIVGPLKTRFTNDVETKNLVRALLKELGCKLEETYFDVPRLRIVPHSNYLSAGVSYAYKPHRDIWYSSPTFQLNMWMPVFSVVPERAMSFFPAYFNTPVANSSADFDYTEWCTVGRRNAVAQVKQDNRKHPLPLAPVDFTSELRIAGTHGDMLIFSASHLHATAPNESKRTRFSIDFRTINVNDLRGHKGGPNADSKSTGTTLGDFLRSDDFTPLDEGFLELANARSGNL